MLPTLTELYVTGCLVLEHAALVVTVTGFVISVYILQVTSATSVVLLCAH